MNSISPLLDQPLLQHHLRRLSDIQDIERRVTECLKVLESDKISDVVKRGVLGNLESVVISIKSLDSGPDVLRRVMDLTKKCPSILLRYYIRLVDALVRLSDQKWSVASVPYHSQQHPFIELAFARTDAFNDILSLVYSERHWPFYLFCCLATDNELFATQKSAVHPWSIVLERGYVDSNIVALYSEQSPLDALSRLHAWSRLSEKHDVTIHLLADACFMADKACILDWLKLGNRENTSFETFVMLASLVSNDFVDEHSLKVVLDMLLHSLETPVELVQHYAGLILLPVLQWKAVLKDESCGHQLDQLLNRISELSQSQLSKKLPELDLSSMLPVTAELITLIVDPEKQNHKISWMSQSCVIIRDGCFDMDAFDDLVEHPYAAGHMVQLLPLVFYCLNRSTNPADIFCLLTRTTPLMVSCAKKDAQISSKLSQLLLYLCQSSKTSLRMIAVQGLFESWKSDTYFWPAILDVCTRWINQLSDADLLLQALFLFREICRLKPLDHGHQILPFVDQLSKRKLLSPMALHYLFDIINACVRANMVDPQAMWNVLVRPLMKKIETETFDSSITQSLCEFYGLVSEMGDSTEGYLIFKNEVLTNHLLPLVLTFETGPALKALGSYETFEFAAAIPPPQDFVIRVLKLDGLKSDARALLVQLLDYEIKNMRRSVFKGTGIAVGGESASSMADSLLFKFMKQLLDDLELSLVDYWDGSAPSVTPSLRSGFSVATLYLARGVLNGRLQRNPTERGKEIESFYDSILSTATQDISPISDGFYGLLEGVGAWTRFYIAILPDLIRKRVRHWIDADREFAKNKSEQHTAIGQFRDRVIVDLIDDLAVKRFKSAHLPIIKLNLCYAVAGLILSLNTLSIPDGFRYACIAGRKIQVYLRPAKAESVGSDENFNNDQLQAALIVSLTYMLPLIVNTDENLAETLMTRFYALRGHKVTESVVFAYSFTSGYSSIWLALKKAASGSTLPGSLSYSLDMYKSDARKVLSVLESVISSQAEIDDHTSLQISGFLMGLSLLDKRIQDDTWMFRELIAKVTKLLTWMSNLMKMKSSAPQLGISASMFGLLHGCLYTIAGPNAGDVDQPLRVIQTVSSGRREIQDTFLSVLLARSRISQTSLISHASTDEYAQDILKEIASGNLTTNQKTIRLNALMTSIGLLPPSMIEVMNSTIYDVIMNSNIAQDNVLPILRVVAEHMRGGGNNAEAKVNRATMVLISQWLSAWFPSGGFGIQPDTDSFDILGESDGGGGKLMMETEPLDYRRLNPTESYLRTLFEHFNTLVEREDLGPEFHTMLDILTTMSQSLPAVNWTVLLHKLYKKESLKIVVLKFVSRHALTSKSHALFLPAVILDASYFALDWVLDDALPVLSDMVVQGHIQVSKWVEIVQGLFDRFIYQSAEVIDTGVVLRLLRVIWSRVAVIYKVHLPLRKETAQLVNETLINLPMNLMGIGELSEAIGYCYHIVHLDNPTRVIAETQKEVISFTDKSAQFKPFNVFIAHCYVMGTRLLKATPADYVKLLHNEVLVPVVNRVLSEEEGKERFTVWSKCLIVTSPGGDQGYREWLLQILDMFILAFSTLPENCPPSRSQWVRLVFFGCLDVLMQLFGRHVADVVQDPRAVFEDNAPVDLELASYRWMTPLMEWLKPTGKDSMRTADQGTFQLQVARRLLRVLDALAGQNYDRDFRLLRAFFVSIRHNIPTSGIFMSALDGDAQKLLKLYVYDKSSK